VICQHFHSHLATIFANNIPHSMLDDERTSTPLAASAPSKLVLEMGDGRHCNQCKEQDKEASRDGKSINTFNNSLCVHF
jgi:hypothetical protein